MTQPNVLAIFPARGGSKGIPRKNVRLFAGYASIAYSIAAGLQFGPVTRVILMSDAVEAARQVTAVHQNHDYSHLPGNKPSFGSETAVTNLRLAGGRYCGYNILDANREMVNGRIRKPQPRQVRLLRRLEHLFINDSGHGWRWELALRLQKMQRPLASKPRR